MSTENLLPSLVTAMRVKVTCGKCMKHDRMRKETIPCELIYGREELCATAFGDDENSSEDRTQLETKINLLKQMQSHGRRKFSVCLNR